MCFYSKSPFTSSRSSSFGTTEPFAAFADAAGPLDLAVASTPLASPALSPSPSSSSSFSTGTASSSEASSGSSSSTSSSSLASGASLLEVGAILRFLAAGGAVKVSVRSGLAGDRSHWKKLYLQHHPHHPRRHLPLPPQKRLHLRQRRMGQLPHI